MCLSIVYDEERTQRLIAVMPRLVPVWKVFGVKGGLVLPPCFGGSDTFIRSRSPVSRMCGPLNIDKTIMTSLYDRQGYSPGYHSFVKQEDGQRWFKAITGACGTLQSGGLLKRCYVRRKDILVMGKEYSCSGVRGDIIVSRRIIVPRTTPMRELLADMPERVTDRNMVAV